MEKLVYSHEHGNGVAFDSVKETIGKIMCQNVSWC